MRLAALVLVLGWATMCHGLVFPNTTYLIMQFEAFTIFDLVLYNANENITTGFCRTEEKNGAGSVLTETKRQLECTFMDSSVPEGSPSVGLWNDVWEGTAACLGVDGREYFRLMAEFYNKYNPNVFAREYNVAPPTVERDGLLAKLQMAYGKRGWATCEPSTRNLITMEVCMSPVYPYDIRDCPYAAATDGAKCKGTLNMPTDAASPAPIKTPDECEVYVKSAAPAPGTSGTPRTSPTGSSSPPPNDGGSSVPIGAIIGGVVAGLAVVAAVVIGIVMARRKRRRDGGRPEGGLGAVPADANGTNGTNGMQPYAYAGTDPTFASTPPADAMAASAGSPTAGVAARSTGSASYPSTPVSPYDIGTLSARRSGSANLSNDPLLKFINSTLSTISQTSRGSLKSWELLFQDIKVERPIGEGSWGRVYKGTYHETQVAVKVLLDNDKADAGEEGQNSLLSANGSIMDQLEQEAALMSNLHHPNIVHLLAGICIYPASIVTEYCARGSLTAVLSAGRASPERAAELTWSRRISMAADCCRGMLYLHSRRPPIIHRDLKSANLLVTATWKLKVSDFNLSKIMEDTTRSTSLQAMNPRWLAPEVLDGSAASLASDVFAMGVIFWELLTWQLPWGSANPWGIVSQINAGNRLPVPAPGDLPGPNSGNWDKLDAYVALMNRCWAQKPEDRPSFGEVMAELRNIDPAAVEANVN